MKKKVTYRCIKNSFDWGKKGATNTIVFPEDATEELIKSYAPGNWRIEKIEYQYELIPTTEE